MITNRGRGRGLESEPVHGGTYSVVLWELLDGADGCHSGTPVVDVPGCHFLHLLGCYTLKHSNTL